MTVSELSPDTRTKLQADHHDKRDDHQYHQSHLPFNAEHESQRYKDRKSADKDIRKSINKESRYSVSITHNTCHKTSGLTRAEETDRELSHISENALFHIPDNARYNLCGKYALNHAYDYNGYSCHEHGKHNHEQSGYKLSVLYTELF